MTDLIKQRADRKKMRAAVAYLQKYMATYDKQPDYDLYRVETLINDVLYGLGVAIEEIDGAHYQFADGFDRFKVRLAKLLPAEPAAKPMPEWGGPDEDTMANPRGGYSTERPGL